MTIYTDKPQFAVVEFDGEKISALRERVYQLEKALYGMHVVYCGRFCCSQENAEVSDPANHTTRCAEVVELLKPVPDALSGWEP